MNEPRLRGHAHEWYYKANCNDCIYGAQTINKLNQIALNTIRESGGNNKKRFVMIPGIAGSFDCVTGKNNPFKLPKDYTDEKITNQRLIMSIHLYKPHTLAMENPGESAFNDRHKKELDFYFETMNKDFIQNGIPVVIGEYGCTNKNNLEDRVNYFNYYTDKAKEIGISCVLWDNGDYNTNGTFLEKFGYYNRLEQTWYFPEIIQAILD
jgi:endoglucanase